MTFNCKGFDRKDMPFDYIGHERKDMLFDNRS